ncbi:MAG TPA: hypothetical protein VJ179_00915 [Patescibacteria group bacterium]|nr:hypothetical protein [Patescibacteria group bacterium]
MTDTENMSFKKQSRMVYLKLLLIAVISTAISACAALWIAENFFFDKFFYQKSLTHGYWPPERSDLSLKSFGKRGEEIFELKESAKDFNPHKSTPVLGAKDDEVFTIAVFGDSLVWGNGLKEKDRFVTILEKKLNKITPTRVLSLAHPGDSLLDNYIKVQVTSSYKPDIDLVIFTLVDNDLFFNEETRYNETLYKEIISGCNKKPLLRTSQFEPLKDSTAEHERYMSNLEKSFSDKYGNVCVFETIAARLPQQKTMYFIFGPQFNTPWMIGRLRKTLEENKLTIVTPETLSEIEFGSREWKSMFVSKQELHPSVTANRIFAEKLFQEITLNPRWVFTEVMGQ